VRYRTEAVADSAHNLSRIRRVASGCPARLEHLPDALRKCLLRKAQVAYYLPRTLEGRDGDSLADLGRRCTGVFLEHAGAELEPAGFAPAFLASIVFQPLPGAAEGLARLRDAGLALACVSNWDISLRGHLERADLADCFAEIVSSAEAGVAKPEAAVFFIALDRLGVVPERALHIGDSDNDSDGAAAAGLAFEPPPVATLPERLGLGRRP
jgi:putative hydrolase of the HAD superfamily